MPIVDRSSGARVEEVADRIYQIHRPVPGDAFSFNQYLVADDAPLIFHTGPRGFASLVLRGIASVMPVERLFWIGYSHCGDDECGGMAELLAAAPKARPVTGPIGTMLNGTMFDRPTLALKDGEVLRLGGSSVTWLDAPHLPHGWDCGYLFEHRTATLLCGDLITQPGARGPAVTSENILGPSEDMRMSSDYFAQTPASGRLIEKLATTKPALLACMHGSAALLRALAARLAESRRADRE